MDKKLTKQSKFLSLLLRHQPEMIGLVLDGQGWASVEELIEKTAQSKQPFTRTLLHILVDQDAKQHYAFNENETKIRANQGHSLNLELELEEKTPPARLFHGTASRFLDSIRATGLERHHVHLSADSATAIQVGKRHGKPVVLEINAAAMQAAGHRFWRSANGVWLCNAVPVHYIVFPEIL